MTFHEIKNNADNLRKAKKFAQSLEFYTKLWKEFPEQCNEWVAWGYAVCLQKEKKHVEALEICDKVMSSQPDFPNIKGVYVWSLYYTQIKLEIADGEELFLHSANQIIKYARQDDNFSPYTMTVFKVLEHIESKQVYEADHALEWLGKLRPELLDQEPFAYVDPNGNQRELASKMEQYHMMLSKAYLQKERWTECIEVCKNALKTIPKLHYNNEIWFTRKMAIAESKLGNTLKAIDLLKELSDKRSDWFISAEIASLLFDAGDTREGMEYAVAAAQAPGEPDKKINLFKLMAEMLISMDKIEWAQKHVQFVYAVRKQKNWKIDSELQHLIEQLDVDTTRMIDPKRLFNHIRNIWDDVLYADQERYEGKIKSLLPTGTAGFIEDMDRKTYYFRRKDFKGKTDFFVVGTPVTFYVQEGFDTKKNRPSFNAVNVRMIKPTEQ